MSPVLWHAGHAPSPGGFWLSWYFDPEPTVVLLTMTTLYLIGSRRLALEAPNAAYPTWRKVAYLSGIASLVLALLSPIAAYGERLFFIHMIQHMLLLMIAPPLLLLGAPMLPMLWALPRGWRRRLTRLIKPGSPLQRAGNALTTPWVAVMLYVATVAIWHLPKFYDAAQGRTLAHDIEHLMFFGTAMLYWWPVVHPARGRRRLSFGFAVPYLVPPFAEGTLIGIYLTFLGQPIYETYQFTDQPWGFSALSDQQLAGLLMWVPGGMLFLVPLIGILSQIVRDEEQNATRPRPKPHSSTP